MNRAIELVPAITAHEEGDTTFPSLLLSDRQEDLSDFPIQSRKVLHHVAQIPVSLPRWDGEEPTLFSLKLL